jgi:hypothetical protein
VVTSTNPQLSLDTTKPGGSHHPEYGAEESLCTAHGSIDIDASRLFRISSKAIVAQPIPGKDQSHLPPPWHPIFLAKRCAERHMNSRGSASPWHRNAIGGGHATAASGDADTLFMPSLYGEQPSRLEFTCGQDLIRKQAPAIDRAPLGPYVHECHDLQRKVFRRDSRTEIIIRTTCVRYASRIRASCGDVFSATGSGGPQRGDPGIFHRPQRSGFLGRARRKRKVRWSVLVQGSRRSFCQKRLADRMRHHLSADAL